MTHYDTRSVHLPGQRWLRGCALLLALAGGSVAAQTPLEMPTRLDRFHIFANGNIVTNKYASAFEAEGIRLAQNARIYGSSTTGGVSLSKQLALNTRNGVVVAEARQKISARQIAKGIAALASGPAGWALVGVPLILDLLDDAGLVVGEHEGATVIGAPTNANLYNATCINAQPNKKATLAVHVEECAWQQKQFEIANGRPNCVVTGYYTGSGPNYPIRVTRTGVCSGTPDQLITTATLWQTNAPGFEPLSDQQIEDAITSANPSPGVLKELADKGITPNPDPSDPGQITNPQPSQEKTTTKTNPDGSTETTVCQTTGTVVGNTLKLNESCTTTLRDPQGNITGTTTTTTDDADPQPAQEDQSLLCEVFPNIAACATLDTPEGDVPTIERQVTYAPEVVALGSGSCPAPLTANLTYGTITMNVTPWCDVMTDVIRPLFLLIAAFTAFFIVAPVWSNPS